VTSPKDIAIGLIDTLVSNSLAGPGPHEISESHRLPLPQPYRRNRRDPLNRRCPPLLPVVLDPVFRGDPAHLAFAWLFPARGRPGPLVPDARFINHTPRRNWAFTLSPSGPENPPRPRRRLGDHDYDRETGDRDVCFVNGTACAVEDMLRGTHASAARR